MCFFLVCLPPGRRLLLTSGMGIAGTIWNHFGSILDHFKTPYMQKIYVFQKLPKYIFYMFIYTESYTGSHKTSFKITNVFTNHTNTNSNTCPTIHVPKTHKCWVPQASLDSFWANKTNLPTWKYARCDYTSVTCPLIITFICLYDVVDVKGHTA